MEIPVDTNISKEKKKNRANNFMIIVIILLLGFCGYLIWQNRQLQKLIVTNEIVITGVSSERDQVKADLEDMLAQYNAMETTNEKLNAELAIEKQKIEELIKKAKGKDWSIYQLKKETETLRKIMKGLYVELDSLQQANGALEKENYTVKTALNNEKNVTKNLTEKNEDLADIVTVASYLKTSELKSYGVRVKNDNTGKMTDKAKRADKIRTEFSILKNSITIPGKKWIYVRILSPDGKVLSEKTDDSNKFNFNGVRGLYTSKKEIDYKNQQLSLTIDWNKIEDFSIGEYNIEIYADGVDIGKTKCFLE